MSEIQKAIEILKSGHYNPDTYRYEYANKNIVPALESTEKVMQEQAEREKGCEWCNKGLRFECNLIDSEGNTASVENNVVQTCIADFCPHCGRDLRKPVEK